MIHVLAIITAKPGMRGAILEAFAANMPAVLAEAGCVEYVPTIDAQGMGKVQTEIGPDTFVVIEKWESLDALKAHGAAPHMAAYAAKTRDLIASRDHPRPHAARNLTAAPRRRCATTRSGATRASRRSIRPGRASASSSAARSRPRDGRIVFAGAEADLPAGHDSRERISLDGRWITPGLVDCHTHLVHAGDRAHEFELRLAGASYEEIARAGGGILSTVRATRAADEDELVRTALPRLDRLIAEGVTTVEVKSGYGLEARARRSRMLRAARRLGRERPVRVATSYLGAHAFPRQTRTAEPTWRRSAPRSRGSRPRGLRTRSTPSASASPSRRRRRRACSRLHGRPGCP